jgi:tetratricopeptide (TPR) repeat protein
MMGTLRAKKPCFPLALFVLLLLGLSVAYGQQGPPDTNPNPSATFEQLSSQAAASREAGRVDEAIRFYQAAVKLQSDWAEGWWYLGTLNYDADRYADAIPALQQLIALNPEMGPALAFLGLSEFETKDYENSLVHLQKAQQEGYGDDSNLATVAAYHLALLFNRSAKFEKTVEVLRPTVERGRPPDEIKVALGMALLRIPLLISEVDPGKEAMILAAGQAAVMLDSGDMVAAADSLQQLLVKYPKTPYLHCAYAAALAGTGKYEEALRELREETRVSPRSALPYLRMASLNLQLHQAKAALPSARKAVLLAPRSAATHDVLARTLRSLGQNQEAAKELAVARKLGSNAVELDVAQRELYVRSKAGLNITQQAAIGEVPGRQSPVVTDSEALEQKAKAAKAAGQIETAVSYYQRALTLRPEWEEGWRSLGTLYYSSARYADAAAALKNAVAINARNGNAWALLGLSEFETRDYEDSLIHLERGRDLGLEGNAAAVQFAKYHLGVLLNRKGDFDAATKLLTPEVTAGAPDEQVTFALGMALLRIPLLPDELDHSKDSFVRLAGETAVLLSASKYDQAFANFQHLLKMNSSTPYLHYVYGTALASISRFDEAEEQLVEETKITPGSPLPFLRRSTIALQLHHADGAAQFAQRAVQLAPESAEGHYLLGRAWLELGKTVDSVKELETARGLAPNSPDLRFALARAYAKAGRPDEAAQERAAFERLNALVQSQRSRTGSQAYGAVKNQNGIQAAEGEKSTQTSTTSHPD